MTTETVATTPEIQLHLCERCRKRPGYDYDGAVRCESCHTQHCIARRRDALIAHVSTLQPGIERTAQALALVHAEMQPLMPDSSKTWPDGYWKIYGAIQELRDAIADVWLKAATLSVVEIANQYPYE